MIAAPTTTVITPVVIGLVAQEQKVAPIQSRQTTRQEEAARVPTSGEPSRSSRSGYQTGLLLALAGALVIVAVLLVVMGRRKGAD